MAVDDSFKKPGAIPFKWEIRPGVPKVHQSQNHQKHASSEQQQCEQQRQQPPKAEEFSFPETPRKLAPPPAGYYFQPPREARTRSFWSAPRSRSERYQIYSSNLARPDSVFPGGCFPSPSLSRKNEKNKMKKPKPKPHLEPLPEPEMYCASDLETLSRWSVSSRKSLSPFRDSYSPSSFSSYRSSPRPVINDAHWVGFGLF